MCVCVCVLYVCAVCVNEWKTWRERGVYIIGVQKEWVLLLCEHHNKKLCFSAGMAFHNIVSSSDLGKSLFENCFYSFVCDKTCILVDFFLCLTLFVRGQKDLHNILLLLLLYTRPPPELLCHILAHVILGKDPLSERWCSMPIIVYHT